MISQPFLFSFPMTFESPDGTDLYAPALWARESLIILQENMVAAANVKKSFSNEIARFGDTVNTRRPTIISTTRKTPNQAVTETGTDATPVKIVLNQHVYNSFLIYDATRAKSFKDLVTEFIHPAAIGMAEQIDRTVLSMTNQIVMTNRVGQLQSITPSNARALLVSARQALNTQKAPDTNERVMIWGSSAESQVLNSDLFVKALERGHGGRALDRGAIGHVFGMMNHLDQNISSVSPLFPQVATGTITGSIAAGATGSQTCVISGYSVVVGSFATVAGDANPKEISARTFSTNTTAITFTQPMDNATVATAGVTVYKPFTFDVGYAAGYTNEVLLDGNAGNPPQIGQGIATGTTGGANRAIYTAVAVTAVTSTQWSVLLDRPLDNAVSSSDPAFPMPAGGYNLAMHPDAFALISRPLPMVMEGLGAKTAVADVNGLGMRITMAYDSSLQAMRVTMDILLGIAILNANLAVCVQS